jgi:hypothetical protein
VRRTTLIALAALAFAARPALALDDLHGRVQIENAWSVSRHQSLAAALGERVADDGLANFRLTWEPKRGPWSLAVHYVLDADAGGAARLARRQTAMGLAPDAPDAHAVLDLTDTLVDRGSVRLTQRLDRLSVGYSGDRFVVRLGRQTLTWGPGLVFHPMDLFAPFAPQATDTEYKAGVDMAYGQWLFDDGSDLQLVVVPRRPAPGRGLAERESSAALHYQKAVGAFQTTWLVARDHGDVVVGAAVGGALGGATWNIEAIPTFERGGPVRTSVLANISGATVVRGRDVTLFAEYFHNGFGVDGRGYALSDLPADLRARLDRGQLFDTGLDYLSVGATVTWTPLLRISPSLIANLRDHSAFALAHADYSLGDNLELTLGGQLPIGSSGSEFGGLAISGGAQVFAAPAAQLYVRLRRYF